MKTSHFLRLILLNIIPVALSLLFPLGVGACALAAIMLVVMIFIYLWLDERLLASVIVYSIATVFTVLGFIASSWLYYYLIQSDVFTITIVNIGSAILGITGAFCVLSFIVIEITFRKKKHCQNPK